VIKILLATFVKSYKDRDIAGSAIYNNYNNGASANTYQNVYPNPGVYPNPNTTNVPTGVQQYTPPPPTQNTCCSII